MSDWEKEFPNLDRLADTVGRADAPSGLGIDRAGLWNEIQQARAIIGAAQKMPGTKFLPSITGPAIDPSKSKFITGPEQDNEVCPVCKRPI